MGKLATPERTRFEVVHEGNSNKKGTRRKLHDSLPAGTSEQSASGRKKRKSKRKGSRGRVRDLKVVGPSASIQETTSTDSRDEWVHRDVELDGHPVPVRILPVKLFNSEAESDSQAIAMTGSMKYSVDVYLKALEVIQDHIYPQLRDRKLLNACKEVAWVLTIYADGGWKEEDNGTSMQSVKQVAMWQSPALREYFPAVCLQTIVQTFLRGCATYDNGLSKFPDTRNLNLDNITDDGSQWASLDVLLNFGFVLPDSCTYTPDFSPKRLDSDLQCILQAVLPQFNAIQVLHQALSSASVVSSPPCSSKSRSGYVLANTLVCLDVAESVSKLIPGFGVFAEGVCGVLRKILVAAEGARAARDECQSLAEHTSSITLAIMNEIGPSQQWTTFLPESLFELRETLFAVETSITALSKWGRFKCFVRRDEICTQVHNLQARLDNARIAFQIRADITTMQILSNLQSLHTQLLQSIHDEQVSMNRKLDRILDGQDIREEFYRRGVKHMNAVITAQ